MMGSAPGEGHALTRRIRRYRRSYPQAQIQPGPFDWEQYLATSATEQCALYFEGGLLVFAAAAWGDVRSPSLKVAPRDLIALHDALDLGTRLIVLPTSWRNSRPTFRSSR